MVVLHRSLSQEVREEVAMMRIKMRLTQWLRFQFFAQILVLVFYVPYNVIWIGYSPVQLVKWLVTAAPYSVVFNTALQLWLAFVRRMKWLK
jgi:hypothetical protein